MVVKWLIGICVGLYIVGFGAVFVFHLSQLQMVTPGLAAYRALVWPVWVATGRPRGSPVPMGDEYDD